MQICSNRFCWRSRPIPDRVATPALPGLLNVAGARAPLGLVLADAEFDSEANHQHIRQRLRARSIIPANLRRGLPRGAIRSQMHRAFPRKQYGPRAKNETIFSVVKRKLSSRAPGRLLTSQIRQALLLGLTYNLYRLRHPSRSQGCQQKSNSLNLDDFALKLLMWYRDGFFTPDRRVFDCGLQTREAIQALIDGVSPESSGPNEEFDNGNGSLMRVLPLALWHKGPADELVREAGRQSAITHGPPRAQVCCAFYCLWARQLLEGASDGWQEAAQALGLVYEATPDLKAELDFVLAPSHGQRISGSGYVLDTLWTARRALQESSYQSVVRQAIRFGNDTDTSACVAGGLAGIRGGIRSIPEQWVRSLRGATVYKPLLRQLVERLYKISPE